jgi:hypothetical protein
MRNIKSLRVVIASVLLSLSLVACSSSVNISNSVGVVCNQEKSDSTCDSVKKFTEDMFELTKESQTIFAEYLDIEKSGDKAKMLAFLQKNKGLIDQQFRIKLNEDKQFAIFLEGSNTDGSKAAFKNRYGVDFDSLSTNQKEYVAYSISMVRLVYHADVFDRVSKLQSDFNIPETEALDIQETYSSLLFLRFQYNQNIINGAFSNPYVLENEKALQSRFN